MKKIFERKVGGYTLLRELGRGGMGAVYEAVNDGGDHVALKLLHPSVAEDESSRERLRREVAVLRRVRSPYVAEVIDAEFEAVEPFIVTELIRGLTLEQDVQVNGLYTDEDLYRLGYQLGKALAAVHDDGVLHRDIKPSNVMLCSSQDAPTVKGRLGDCEGGETFSQSRPVLIDFGIAQLEGSTRLTQPGSLAFTPSYCDPRMIEGAAPDEEGDWWALAAVLAYAACGEPPFGQGSASAVIHRVLANDLSMPDVDPGVRELFRRALRKDVRERLSYEELIENLRDPSSVETLDFPRIAPTVVSHRSDMPVSTVETVAVDPVPAAETVPLPAQPVPAGEPQPSFTSFQPPEPERVGNPEWAREPRRARLLAALLWISITIASMRWSLPAASIFVLAMLLCDVVGSGFLYVRDRRLRTGGARAGDYFVCMLRLPLLLVKSTVRTVGMCAIALLPLWFILTERFDGMFEYVSPPAYGLACAVATMTLWLLPTGRSARIGLRVLAGGMSHTRFWYRLWLIAAVCIVAFVILYTVDVLEWMP